MLIWLNGPFGVGKTSVAKELLSKHSSFRLFDPEQVGYMLRACLPDVPNEDFQDLLPWRSLVPRVGAELFDFANGSLVAVQSVLVQKYWEELVAGFQKEGLRPFHIVLDCEPRELRRRVLADDVERGAEQWRLDHIDNYLAALEWMLSSADLVIDTTSIAASEVADLITARFATEL